MSVGAPIYLDYAATTPVDPAVARAMSEVLSATGDYGNPSAVTHIFGRRTAARVAAARMQVAALIGASAEDIYFTSGATESNNLAILGSARANADRGRHVITSRIEHKAVLDPCKQLEREGFTVTQLTPDSHGRITRESVEAALRPDTKLVSIMHVNNEIGVVQDIEGIGALCRERGVLFHTDAAQSVGKLAIDVSTLPVDLLSFTAHKIYGPQGIGALYVTPAARAQLRPVTFGGGQERGLRPGTLPAHQIVGFGEACSIAASLLASESTRVLTLRARLWAQLSRLEGVHLNGAAAPRVPGILNVSFEGVEGESLVTGLPMLAVTTGSACSSASGEPSYVLRALGRSTQLAQSSLRFSCGRGTTQDDIDAAAVAVTRQVARLRAISPALNPPIATKLSAVAQDRGMDSLNAVALTEPSLQHSLAHSPVQENARSSVPTRDWADSDGLSALARRHFENLAGAGIFPPGPGVIDGEAGGLEEDVWIRFHLSVSGGVVKAALFQGYGCPHTLAVTSWLTGQLPGRARADLIPGTPAAWLEALDVPMEKLGRLLVVEDALRVALASWH